MGRREDAVREAAKKEELTKAVKTVEEIQAAQDARDRETGIRSELLFSINEESKRIASLLEHADWSRTTIDKFYLPKKHWWSRRRYEEYATYFLGTLDPHLGKDKRGRRALMRSDGWLYFEYHYEIMRDSWSGEDWWFEKKMILTSPEQWPRNNKELHMFLEILKNFTI